MTDIRNDSLVNYSTSRKSFPSCLLSEPRRPSLSSREEALYYGGEEEVKASSISDTLCVVCSSQAYSLGKSGPKQSIPMMSSSSSRKANARSLLQLSPIASEIFLLFLLRIASQKKKKLRYRKRCLVLFLLFLQL